MANIMDLDVTSISEMSQEELFNLLHEVRKSRRTSKKVEKPKKEKVPTSKEIDINNLSDDATEALIKQLESML